ncbi:MAG: hypothetical protein NVSMB39_5010 [Candidatus Saccharimonadales bacterium]
MVVSKTSVVIMRPVSEIWEFLMNLDNYPLWQSGVLRVAGTDGPNVGSILTVATFALARKLDLTAEVINNDQHSRYTVRSIQGPLTFTTSYKLAARDGGTEVKFTCQIDTHAVFNLAEPVLQAVANTKN